MGRVLSITDTATTTMTYAKNGMDLTGIKNGLGTIALTYDLTHDITSVTDRLGNKKTFAYNSYGQMTTSIDSLGTVTKYVYDPASHLRKQVTRNGLVLESYTYDSIGRILTYKDASLMTRTYEYNNMDEVTKVGYPDGKYIGIIYSDDIPHLVTAVSAPSGLTQYTYSSSKELSQILGPDGVTTIKFGYDANGKMNELIDSAGNTTKFSYDNDNRLVAKIFADGISNSFSYDTAGRLATFTNARQQNNANKEPTAAYSYLSDNLTQIYYMDYPATGYPIPITPAVSYQYDKYNRRTGMSDIKGTTTYKYDADSRLISATGPFKLDALTFKYDAKGRVTEYTLQGGQSVSYTYDAFDRVTEVSGSAAGTFTYTYSGASPLVQRLTRPNGSYTDYTYDSVKRLIGVANKTSTGAIINQYQYTYNGHDLRAAETITNGTPITSFPKRCRDLYV